MGVFDTSAVAYQLKTVYGNKITDLFNRQTMTYNMFEKSDRKASYTPAGTGYVFAVREKDNEGVGARAENALLPEPLTTAGTQGTITPRLIYAVLRMSGLAAEAGKGDLAAFVDVQGDAIANVYKALVQDLNRQCWGDGTGLLGTLSAVATPDQHATWTATFSNDSGTRYMKPGMICDFYNSTAIDQTASSVRISSINPITKVVTFEASADLYRTYHPESSTTQAYGNSEATIASGSFLVRQGARLAAHVVTTRYEIDGMNAMYDDEAALSTFEGIVIASHPMFKANIIDNGAVNRELSIDLLLAAMDMTYGRTGDMVTKMIMGLGQRRKYFALLANDVRYAPGQFVGGYEKLSFTQNGQVDMIIDPMAQPNKIYMETGSIIKKYELTPIGFGGMDQQKMHWREGYDQSTMFLRVYTNLGVEARPSLTVLDDLVEPSNQPW